MKENFTGPGVRLENYKLLIHLLSPSVDLTNKAPGFIAPTLGASREQHR